MHWQHLLPVCASQWQGWHQARRGAAWLGQAAALSQDSMIADPQDGMEQERRDHELALRLAAESGGGVEDLVIKTQKLSVGDTPGGRGSPDGEPSLNGGGTASNSAAKKGDKKMDLSKWKYAELRDTINTSCDIELLEACREEFHRRLKVYHAWKRRGNVSIFNRIPKRRVHLIIAACLGFHAPRLM